MTALTNEPLQQFTREDPIQPAGGPLSLQDVAESSVFIQWDEAVAVVEELCEVVITASGDHPPVPAPADVLIDSGGRLTLRCVRGEKSPTAAGRLLHTLLRSSGVPMPLRLFVTQSIAQGAHRSLREFADGLGYFGKPIRGRLIADVYARCMHPGQPANPSPVLPVRPLPQRHGEPAKEPYVSRRSLRKRVMRAALAAALGLAITAAWMWRSGRPGHGVQGNAEHIFSNAAAVLADLGQQVRNTLGSAAVTPHAPPVQSSARRPRIGRKNSAPSPSIADSHPEAAPLVNRGMSISGGASGLAMMVPNAVASVPRAAYEQPTATMLEPGPIYSSMDASVDPPVLLFPQLIPAAVSPRTSRSVVNRMVVVVSPEGTVERVQLIEGPARMPDVMLLSGAKTWRFTPAYKDGEPVRYRTVISW